MGTIPQKLLARKHEITTRFLDLLDQHIEDLLSGQVDHQFKISNFADNLFLTSSELTAIVKHTTKRTPLELLEERLHAEAKVMLSDTVLTVKDISKKLAFSSQATFAKFFQKMEERTPQGYRHSVHALH